MLEYENTMYLYYIRICGRWQCVRMGSAPYTLAILCTNGAIYARQFSAV